MKNENDVINAVVKMTALAHRFSSDKREKDLARFILKNYYAVDTFFLNREGDFSSGINMKSVELFIDKMDDIFNVICN
jgi:hypothetical protein